jgi:hypothetical protein
MLESSLVTVPAAPAGLLPGATEESLVLSPRQVRSAVQCIVHRVVVQIGPQGGSPGSGDPPEPEELIRALQDLENSASSDATVRPADILFAN